MLGTKDRTKRAPWVVGFDFSSGGERALEHAAATLEHRGGTLVVVHVVGRRRGAPLPGKPNFAARRDRLEGVAARLRERYPALTVYTRTVTGVVPPTLADEAERVDAEKIVVGGPPRASIGRLLLGSLSEALERLTPIPVSVVQAPARVAETKNPQGDLEHPGSGGAS